MKQNDVIALAIAGIAVWMILKNRPAQAATVGVKKKDWVSEIFNGSGKSFDNGWRYFNDGTAISPEGDYYKNGALLYRQNQSADTAWIGGAGVTVDPTQPIYTT